MGVADDALLSDLCSIWWVSAECTLHDVLNREDMQLSFIFPALVADTAPAYHLAKRILDMVDTTDQPLVTPTTSSTAARGVPRGLAPYRVTGVTSSGLSVPADATPPSSSRSRS